MPLINALFLALAAGTLIALPAVIAELGKPPNSLPLLLDIKADEGGRLSKREVFWLGLLLHYLMAAVFGLGYELLALRDFFSYPFRLGNLLLYGVMFWIFVGAFVMPIFRLGFFGRRGGTWSWFELLIVHLLLAFFIWLGIIIFPVLRP